MVIARAGLRSTEPMAFKSAEMLARRSGEWGSQALVAVLGGTHDLAAFIQGRRLSDSTCSGADI